MRTMSQDTIFIKRKRIPFDCMYTVNSLYIELGYNEITTLKCQIYSYYSGIFWFLAFANSYVFSCESDIN